MAVPETDANEDELFQDAVDDPVVSRAYELYGEEKLIEAVRLLDEHGGGGGGDGDARVREIRNDARELPQYLRDLADESDYVECLRTRSMSVKYRHDARTQLHAYKVEADVRAPLRNLLCVIAETDLYSELFWFVRDSMALGRNGRVRRAAYSRFFLPWPLADRVAYMVGRGIDALDGGDDEEEEETGSVYIVLRSARPEDTQHGVHADAMRVRAQNKRHRYVEMEARACFQLLPLAPHKTRLRLVGLFDPQLSFVPRTLVNWVSRKIVRYGVLRLGKDAARLESLHTQHWARMASGGEAGVYDWLQQRLDAYWERRRRQQRRQQRNEDVSAPALAERHDRSPSVSSDESVDAAAEKVRRSRRGSANTARGKVYSR